MRIYSLHCLVQVVDAWYWCWILAYWKQSHSDSPNLHVGGEIRGKNRNLRLLITPVVFLPKIALSRSCHRHVVYQSLTQLSTVSEPACVQRHWPPQQSDRKEPSQYSPDDWAIGSRNIWWLIPSLYSSQSGIAHINVMSHPAKGRTVDVLAASSSSLYLYSKWITIPFGLQIIPFLHSIISRKCEHSSIISGATRLVLVPLPTEEHKGTQQ